MTDLVLYVLLLLLSPIIGLAGFFIMGHVCLFISKVKGLTPVAVTAVLGAVVLKVFLT